MGSPAADHKLSDTYQMSLISIWLVLNAAFCYRYLTKQVWTAWLNQVWEHCPMFWNNCKLFIIRWCLQCHCCWLVLSTSVRSSWNVHVTMSTPSCCKIKISPGVWVRILLSRLLSWKAVRPEHLVWRLNTGRWACMVPVEVVTAHVTAAAPAIAPGTPHMREKASSPPAFVTSPHPPASTTVVSVHGENRGLKWMSCSGPAALGSGCWEQLTEFINSVNSDLG